MQQLGYSSQSAYKSMYLSTVNNVKRHLDIHKNSMALDDIQGARSKFIEKPRRIRDTFINQNYDIDRSTSRILIPNSVNKKDNQLRTDDIAIRSKQGRFETTRCTNPLDPVYQLPVVYIPVASPPKFIRDNMQIDDIEGVRQRQTFAMRIERAGKTLQKQPIVDYRKKPLIVKSQNFMLDVSDINLKKDKEDHRHTNPLNPVYKVSSNTPNQPMLIGEIQKSKVPQKKEITGTNFSLTTSDIAGAQPSLKHPPKKIPRKQSMQFTKAGSLKRGISSKRDTNPLKPQYKYPGWSQNNLFSTNQRPKTAAQRLDAFLH